MFPLPPEPAISHPLLACLDDWARHGDDEGSPLTGAISIAVKTTTQVECWAAVFNKDLTWCGAVEGIAPDADAIWVLNELEAKALVEGRTPTTGGQVFGKTELLSAFISRYCRWPEVAEVAR